MAKKRLPVEQGNPVPHPEPCTNAMLSRFRVATSSLALSTAVLVVACAGPSGPSLDELERAPQTQFIDGHAYALRVDLWRDFQPGGPPSGLIALVELVERDSLAIPSGVDVDHLWVWGGAELWEASLVDEGHISSPWILVRLGRDGPSWETGRAVDVAVRIVTDAGISHLLRLANQTTKAVG